MRGSNHLKTFGRKPERLFLIMLLLFLNVTFASPLWAVDKMLIVHSALNMFTAPLWMAKDHGFFGKYGLEVETIYIPSGTLGMQSLLGGETKILAADGSSVVNARSVAPPSKFSSEW